MKRPRILLASFRKTLLQNSVWPGTLPLRLSPIFWIPSDAFFCSPFTSRAAGRLPDRSVFHCIGFEASARRRASLMGTGFASTERFLSELRDQKLRPGYVFAGDDIFLYERCRKAILSALVPPEMRDFCLSDLDLTETSIFEALDRARTPSLMAPFQVLFLRNVKTLYARGSKKEEFAAVEEYFRSPNPQALVLFVADHLHISADPRRMDMEDKTRYERIRETLGEWCGMVELAR